jgi:hypothetical protein
MGLFSFLKQGVLVLSNDARVQLYYGQPKHEVEAAIRLRHSAAAIGIDWECPKVRRTIPPAHSIQTLIRLFDLSVVERTSKDVIFASDVTSRARVGIQSQTSCSRLWSVHFKLALLEESEKMRDGEGFEHIGTNPCNSECPARDSLRFRTSPSFFFAAIILRGLDALTTEDKIRETLVDVEPSVTVKNIHIAKEHLTNVSSGYTFVEMSSILDANILYEKLQPYFELDGKYVSVNYSKNNYSTV